ncbi:MAG: SusC/RagA family TonB-linked outer membrane protein [Candidatus Pseudobacter hemicellulosilyticus]|uniref:SusC/RagA family TonB-linked outer membrane protein n=1 Tax=Candidatus Pseudobacter hemicellulosilyticus TaxID=3121375 RepID=A0AAJ5WS79_9BACT|nr:MAG: SusC/RagA family TonB-linked outer membrane protein [Pseudobacter sp.]
MQKTPYGIRDRHGLWPAVKGLRMMDACRSNHQLYLVMKLTAVFLFIALMQVHASGRAQSITLSARELPLKQVFAAIKQQTGFVVFYNHEDLEGASPVTMEANHMPLRDFLDKVLVDRPLLYAIRDRTIVLSRKLQLGLYAAAKPPLTVTGRVTDEEGRPVAGATIQVKGQDRAISADAEGRFTISFTGENALLMVSAVGFTPVTVKAGASGGELSIRLQRAVSPLDETVVIAYGTTSKRFNTGSVGKVTSAEIQRQPVSNPLAALQGRVSGLNITSTNGAPGSAVRVQIRGTNSLTNGSEPLYIIDGVQFAPGNESVNRLASVATAGAPSRFTTVSATAVSSGTSSTTSGLSPFNVINPADIESIEVLKDADATAIYGSRGANGVVLITTKKGRKGKLSVDANFYTGASRVTRFWDMMNTQQYLEMRKEAFRNDGVTPTVQNAPDLMLWDSTSYTDWQRLLIGGTAKLTDANASISGGSDNVQAMFGVGYREEGNVFPGGLKNTRATLNGNIRLSSTDKKFTAALQLNYANNRNNSLTGFSSGVNLPPNAPQPFDSTGKLNWGPVNGSFANPFAEFLRASDMELDNLMASLQLRYRILPSLTFNATLGHNLLKTEEVRIIPSASYNPNFPIAGYSMFANSAIRGWRAEPTLEFNQPLGEGQLSVLAGVSWQADKSEGSTIYANGYASDAFLYSLRSASSYTTTASFSEYKYAAVFGRINYRWRDQYILNLSARRDGSSRFGNGSRYNNFGSAGAAWIFSEAGFMEGTRNWLSFGKLRGSYGVTGSDQIGNYMYLDTWSPVELPYDNQFSLQPTGLFNSNYNWERNRKLEFALELGFWNNRVLPSIAYYRNRSSNQLVQYRLPAQTGFGGVIRNFPALIQNSGWEFELSAELLTNRAFTWNVALNVSVPENKLLEFPGIEKSSYANIFVVGESVNLVKGYRSKGVNPETGVYILDDRDGNGSLNAQDHYVLGSLAPKYFGGISNSFGYKGFRMDVFVEFKNRFGYTPHYSSNYAGTMSNLPVSLLDRWQKPGDVTRFQRFTRGSSPAYSLATRVLSSDIAYGDLTYARLKNLEISYSLPEAWMKKVAMQRCRIYVQGQNLLTFSKEKDFDPEMPNNNIGIPPLRTFAAGIQFSF